MKKLIKNALSNFVKKIGKTKLGAFLYSEIIRFSIASNQTIMHKDIELKFVNDFLAYIRSIRAGMETPAPA